MIVGQKISEDPDDEESTNTFVELRFVTLPKVFYVENENSNKNRISIFMCVCSESFPSMFQSLIDEINTIVSGSLLDSGMCVEVCDDDV